MPNSHKRSAGQCANTGLCIGREDGRRNCAINGIAAAFGNLGGCVSG
jgi:hypothetical protein